MEILPRSILAIELRGISPSASTPPKHTSAMYRRIVIIYICAIFDIHIDVIEKFEGPIGMGDDR